MSWETFSDLVKQAGMEPVNRGRGHWQIKGGTFLVNFYPGTDTIYIAGTHSKKGIQNKGSYEDAIKAARRKPRRRSGDRKDDRMPLSRARRIRRKLLQKDPHCHWCRRYVEEKARYPEMKATLDHVIPLDRGGSNGLDNLVLACKPCNDKRANRMPEMGDKEFRERMKESRERWHDRRQ